MLTHAAIRDGGAIAEQGSRRLFQKMERVPMHTLVDTFHHFPLAK
jgi:hypothetical protein